MSQFKKFGWTIEKGIMFVRGPGMRMGMGMGMGMEWNGGIED